MNFGSLIPWRDDKSRVPATREEYLDPFVSFRREVDRMFDDFLSGFGSRGSRSTTSGWQSPNPTIDIAETDEELVVIAELPGLEQKDFEVTMAGNALIIKGEKKAEHQQKNGDIHYMERRFGSFSRAVQLPFEVKDEAVEAKYDKGVLTIRVPKPAEAQKTVRRIEVKAA